MCVYLFEKPKLIMYDAATMSVELCKNCIRWPASEESVVVDVCDDDTVWWLDRMCVR